MKKELLYVIPLLALMLFVSCSKDGISENDEDGNYMQLNTRAGEDSDSDKPCFLFWTATNFNAPGFSSTLMVPYTCCLPENMIDDYNAALLKPKYNTRKIYPPYAEQVYAVGISPGSIVDPGTHSDWSTFAIPTTKAGLIDIQCAPVISANEQAPFSTPLTFTHQLAKLEFKGYCGTSMYEDIQHFINIKDIKISISSDVDNQWQWLPKELKWNHGGVGVGQYKINAYGGAPASPIVAQVSSSVPAPGITLFGKDYTDADDDENKKKAEPIGNFYLVPGFDKITIKIEATYIDSTKDGMAPGGNGQEIKRVWETMTIKDIHAGTGVPTLPNYSYTIYLKFEKNKIILGVTLKDWDPEIVS